jgi:hypothetical protein
MIGRYAGRRYGPGEHHAGWDDRQGDCMSTEPGCVIEARPSKLTSARARDPRPQPATVRQAEIDGDI